MEICSDRCHCDLVVVVLMYSIFISEDLEQNEEYFWEYYGMFGNRIHRNNAHNASPTISWKATRSAETQRYTQALSHTHTHTPTLYELPIFHSSFNKSSICGSTNRVVDFVLLRYTHTQCSQILISQRLPLHSLCSSSQFKAHGSTRIHSNAFEIETARANEWVTVCACVHNIE